MYVKFILTFAYVYFGLLIPTLILFTFSLHQIQRSTVKIRNSEIDNQEESPSKIIQISLNKKAGIIGLVIGLIIGGACLALSTLLFSRFNILLAIFLSLNAIGCITYFLTTTGVFKSRFSNSARIALCIIIASASLLFWHIYPNWLTNNLVFIGVMAGIMHFLGANIHLKLKHLLLVAAGTMIYDFWGVMVSGFIISYVNNLTNLTPLTLIIPFNPIHLDMDYIIQLGSGDLLLSWITVSTAAAYHLEKAAIIGFCIGVLFLLIVPIIFGLEFFPATLALLPCILAAIFIDYLIKGKPEREIIS
jgi:hypothetical protein